MSKTDLISIEQIEKFIYLIRGEKVMLDHDLAELYQVQVIFSFVVAWAYSMNRLRATPHVRKED